MMSPFFYVRLRRQRRATTCAHVHRARWADAFMVDRDESSGREVHQPKVPRVHFRRRFLRPSRVSPKITAERCGRAQSNRPKTVL
jgi:hypothetical protein